MLVYEPDGSGVYQAATIAKYLRINGEPVSRDGSELYRELRLDPLNPLDPQPLSVGHSYGGMVISGVAEKAGSRLAHLVYLDAFLPEDGKAMRDYAPVPPTRDDGWRIPVPESPRGFGVTDEDDIAWVHGRLGDQPLLTFTQPIKLSRPSRIPKSYIQCTEAPFFAEAATRARGIGYRYHALLSAGHDAMITRPKELARILLQV